MINKSNRRLLALFSIVQLLLIFVYHRLYSYQFDEKFDILNMQHIHIHRQFSGYYIPILQRLNLIDSNLDSSMNYSFSVTDTRNTVIDLDSSSIVNSMPIFVSAWSSNHHAEAYSLCKYIIAYKGLRADQKTFIVYNIGLTNEQIDDYRKSCTFVQFRDFNFSSYPLHIRNPKEYRFKPLVIAEMLLEYASIWWLDTSIRFTNKNISMAHTYDAFRHANNNRLQFSLFGWSIKVLFSRNFEI
jgi:hypothetical protein